MKKFYIVILLATVVITFTQFNCKSPTAPKGSNPPDTTSNNFTFQSFTFGASNAGSSHLSDVAIVSDTDIWCVGAVYLDSADGAPDPFPYSAVHWDGKSWELKKIIVSFRGNQIVTPIDGIYAFSSSDIWLMATDPIHGDGTNWTDYDIRTIIGNNEITISKGWGTNSNSMYFVGRSGNVVSYTNGVWQKIESGTTLDITDIWGSDNPSQILAVANDLGANFLTSIIEITGNNAKLISTYPINYPMSSVWFIPNQHYYAGGNGLYEKHLLTDSLWNNKNDISKYYTTSIRGNSLNDVFTSGSYGEILHWNGVRWKSFMNETALSSGAYGAIAVKGNLVVAVGLDSGKAVILVGKR